MHTNFRREMTTNNGFHKVIEEIDEAACGLSKDDVEHGVIYHDGGAKRKDPSSYLQREEDDIVLCDDCWQTYTLID